MPSSFTLVRSSRQVGMRSLRRLSRTVTNGPAENLETCFDSERNLRNSGWAAKSTLIARSAFRGSKYTSIQAECVSSSRSSQRILAFSMPSNTSCSLALSLKSSLLSSTREGEVSNSTTRESRSRRSAALAARPNSSSAVRNCRSSAPSTVCAVGPSPTTTSNESVARRRISLVNSLSSLRYFSLLPFLMR